jgi:uncharacterized protein YbcI
MEIGSNLWNARLYEGLSVASELAAGFEKPVEILPTFLQALQVYRLVGHLNRTLEIILAGFDHVIEKHAMRSAQPEIRSEAYREARNIFCQLYGVPMVILMVNTRFPHWVLRQRLARLKKNLERLREATDWLDDMSHPEEIRARFDSALADLASGDVVPWAAVE